jgi:hypothetical protein
VVKPVCPAAVMPAPSSETRVPRLSGMVNITPGSCKFRLLAGDRLKKASVYASKSIAESTLNRSPSGRLFFCSESCVVMAIRFYHTAP